MASGLRTYTLTLVAAIFLLLAGPGLANTPCEDMPCCSADVVLLECQNCGPSDCACSLESELPDSQSDNALAFQVRFEIEIAEAKTLELPEVEDREGESPASSERILPVPRDREHVSFASFPNPPPPIH